MKTALDTANAQLKCSMTSLVGVDNGRARGQRYRDK